MGWEKRWNRWYYYAAERIGGRVVKHYLGPAYMGELAAQRLADQCAKDAEERAECAEREKRERAFLDALSDAISPLNDLADALTAAAMVAAGYHYHRGSWRKRRA